MKSTSLLKNTKKHENIFMQLTFGQLNTKYFRLTRILLFLGIIFLSLSLQAKQDTVQQKTGPKIHIAFLWHMHQPIYYPYESIVETENASHYSFSLYNVHTDRTGPYTDWPKNAVQQGIDAGMLHFGSQVSFSGSLIENLNNLEAEGIGFSNWKSHWNYIKNQTTSLGNPRLDMIGFGYHHPLMGLIDYTDIRRQIQWHREAFETHFPGSYSKGFFPPETAFSIRMIPALIDEGIEWVLIDNIHFDRTTENCPTADGSGVLRPNKADIRNPDPGDWLQLNGLWAPLPVSIQWAHQPRYVSYTVPETGEEKRIIGVPASRYLGNEDGRGGFGALNYEEVMSQFEAYNTDPERPILIVLHHDGDNYGGGSESYYNSNFANFVSWLEENSDRFECTTIQDYLDRFPPPEDDVTHIQDGSWLGADSGDPQFKKWNGDPGEYSGTPDYSPDRNSWGVMTAAKNIVETALQVNPSHTDTEIAWEHYLNGQTSCYWYWDGTEIWDSNPTRAANQAVDYALPIAQSGTDNTPPAIYLPQRYPYNPGEIEWDAAGPMQSDFTVWTYVFDLNGLESVTLKYRISDDNNVSYPNEIYEQTAGVGEWQTILMTATSIPSITDPLPLYKADEYSAEIIGYENVLIDYYIEAEDINSNISKSPIQHVWVGDETGGGDNGGSVTWTPENPTLHDVITISTSGLNSNSRLHWGVEIGGVSWQTPHADYWPAGTTEHASGALQTPFDGPDGDGKYHVEIGPFNNPDQVVEKINFVVKIDEGNWNNNNGLDFHISINNDPSPNPIGADGNIITLINEAYNFSIDDFYFQGMGDATFAGIKIETGVSQGELTYSGTDIIEGNDYPVIANLQYVPPAGQTGNPLTSFTFRLKDSEGLYSENAYTMSINVVDPNPVSSNTSITMQMNSAFTFSASNFPFTSYVDANFEGIQICNLPENGSLKYNDADAVVNQDYSDPGLLTFTPAQDEFNTPYTSFMFKVKDDEGLYSVACYTMTINVLSDFPDGVSWYPEEPTQNDMITIVVKNDANMNEDSKLHWGVNDWQQPINEYHPEGSTLHDGTGPAVQTPFVNDGDIWSVNIGPFNNESQIVNSVDFVLYYGGTNWNNNGGDDWEIIITQADDEDEDEDEDTFVNQFSDENSFIKLYPNPMTDRAFIELTGQENEVFDIQLININASILTRIEAVSGETVILYRNQLPSGIYFIRVSNKNSGETQTVKLSIAGKY